MSISDNYVPIRQLGNGVTTMFSGTWAMLAAAYAAVFLEDATTHVQTPQTGGGTDYTLAFSASGFTVTFNVAPPNTKYAVIGRAVALDQIDPYRTSKGFQGEVIEASFDKLTAITQDLSDGLDRSLTFPLGSTAIGILPVPVDDTILAWSGTSGLVKNGPTTAAFAASTAAAAASAAAALISQNAAAASAVTSGNSATASAASAVNSAAAAIAPAYQYSTTTAMVDPGAGKFRLNNAALASVTQIAISALTNDAGNPNILAYLQTWDDSTNNSKGYIFVRHAASAGTYAMYLINAALTDNTTWLQIPVTYIGTSGAFANNDTTYIGFARVGDQGAAGTIVPWVVAAGTANVITGAFSPTVTTLTDGLLLSFRALLANTTTTPTFQANATTARTLTKLGGAALAIGDIPGNLAECFIRYNLANTRWELMNPAASGGDVLIQTQTASASATIDFTTGINSTYSHYIIEISNLVPSGGASLQALLRQGGSFISSSNYSYGTIGLDQAGSMTPNAGASVAFLQVTNGSIAPNHPSSLIIDMFQPNLITGTSLFWRGYDNTGPAIMNSSSGAGMLNTAAATDGIRFQLSAGTITTGTFKLWGRV